MDIFRGGICGTRAGACRSTGIRKAVDVAEFGDDGPRFDEFIEEVVVGGWVGRNVSPAEMQKAMRSAREEVRVWIFGFEERSVA